MDRHDIPFASADELTRSYAAGETDPRDVVEILLERIERLNGDLNAFIHVFAAEARAEAEASAARWRAGCPLGPLDGVPLGVKDLVEIAGKPTGCGSAALKDRVSETTATVVQRLRGAGMIVMGKTQMVEFACGGWGTNVHLGAPRNPWDAEAHRAAGGSSSGSAVAVAAGLVTVALGSDTGGSVRIPASLCNLSGLKTTPGRVSNAGTLPLAKTLDTIGPLARTTCDAALVYEAMRGPDPADPATLPVTPDTPLDEMARSLEGLRLGVIPPAERDGVAPDILAAYDAALETLKSLGAEPVAIELPEEIDAVRTRCGAILMAEGYAATRQWIDRDDLQLDPHVRARLRSGAATTVADYLALMEDRRRTGRVWQQALEPVHALVTPTTPIPAPRLEDVDESAFTLARFTRIGNYLDWCGMAVPTGLDAAGLPMSLQICSWSYLEGRTLRIAAAYQRATDHHLVRPPLPKG